MSKSKTTSKSTVVPFSPAVGPAQIQPPQVQTLDQMQPQDLINKILEVQVNPVGIENLIRQILPQHLMAALDLRMTTLRVDHRTGAPAVHVSVMFAPRAALPVPAPAVPSQG